MNQQPPGNPQPPGTSPGWLDPYGQHQPGTPPPGYWQANDRRWYPPSAAPAGAPSGPVPVGAFPSQANIAPRAPASKSSRAGLFVVLVLAMLMVAGGLALGAMLVLRSGTREEASGGSTEPATLPQPSTIPSTQIDPNGSTDTTQGDLANPTTSTPAGADGSGAGCTYIDSETIVLDILNSGAATASYTLAINFFEGTQLVGETTALIYGLRGGERTVERWPTVGQEGSRCEIVGADVTATPTDPAHEADVSSCVISGVDAAGLVASELSLTNSAADASDYTILTAFVDADGVRRGSGLAIVESVAPGETRTSLVFTITEAQPDLTCDLVSAVRATS